MSDDGVGIRKMKTLKCLENMDVIIDYTTIITVRTLRAEASKWFKAISSGEIKEIGEGKTVSFSDMVGVPDKLDLSASDAHAICCFIRLFFNLKKEDLENGN